jgi:hypothetical protein
VRPIPVLLPVLLLAASASWTAVATSGPSVWVLHDSFVVDCEAWLDIGFYGTTDADAIASAAVRIDDANGVTWFETDIGPSDGWVLAEWIEIPFVAANGSVWPAGPYLVMGAITDSLGRFAVTTGTFELAHGEDAFAPQPFLSITSATGNGPGWHGAPADLYADGSDDCRVAEVAMTVDGAPVAQEHRIVEEGLHDVVVTVHDASGKSTSVAVQVGVDTGAPVVDITSPRKGDVLVRDQSVGSTGGPTLVVGKTTFEAAAADLVSGVADIIWLVDGTIVGHGPQLSHRFPPGAHVVEVTATDAAGNEATAALEVYAA